MSTPSPHSAAPPLLRATMLVGLSTFLSRISGFVRDMAAAHFFGASSAYDAFLVAFRIPNFFRRLFAEGAFIPAFVPVLCRYQAEQPVEAVRRFLGYVAGTLGWILIGVVGMVWLCTTPLVAMMAPGFVGTPRLIWARDMLYLTFPYLFFIAMAGLGGSVLNTYRAYVVPAITPVWLNVSMIACMGLLVPYLETPVYALAIGVLVGGMVQMVFQWPFLYAHGLWVRPRWGWRDPGVQRILRQMLPAILGVSVAQVNMLADTAFASFLPDGSMAWLYFADRLLEFPIGILGATLATVVLPDLSRCCAHQDQAGYQRTLIWACKMVCWFAVPASLSLAILATPMVSTVFQYGAFTTEDVQQSARALVAFSGCLCAVIVGKILVSAFYAQQDMQTPLRAGVWSVVSNVVLCALGLYGTSLQHVALAWALTGSTWVHVAYLVIRFRQSVGSVADLRAVWRSMGQVLVAMVPMAGIFYAGLCAWEDIATAGAVRRWVCLAAILGAGALVYGISLVLLGVRWRHIRPEPAAPAPLTRPSEAV